MVKQFIWKRRQKLLILPFCIANISSFVKSLVALMKRDFAVSLCFYCNYLQGVNCLYISCTGNVSWSTEIRRVINSLRSNWLAKETAIINSSLNEIIGALKLLLLIKPHLWIWVTRSFSQVVHQRVGNMREEHIVGTWLYRSEDVTGTKIHVEGRSFTEEKWGV